MTSTYANFSENNHLEIKEATKAYDEVHRHLKKVVNDAKILMAAQVSLSKANVDAQVYMSNKK